jgi:hypothetical protein
VTLSIESLAHEGNYYCVVSNDSGNDVSADALILVERLMIHYTFESIVDNTVADSSPSGLDGTLTSVVAGGDPRTGDTVGGMVGNAVHFIGGQDPNAAYVATGAHPFDLGINGANARSISAWVKVLNPNNGGLFDMGAYATGQDCSLRTMSIDSGASNGHRWRIQHYGSADRDFTLIPSFDVWIHFVYVYDGVNCRVYANGELVVDYAPSLNTANENPLRVGYYNGTILNGLLDEFRVYNYALSPLEVGQLYIEGVGGSICVENPTFDVTDDCKVALEDFAIFAASWAESTLVSP